MRFLSIGLFIASLFVVAGCTNPQPIELNDQPSDIEQTITLEEQEPTLKSEIPATTDDEIVSQPDAPL